MTPSIEQRLDELLPSSGATAEAARYAVFSGGKRLRPKIALSLAEIFGASPEMALTPACALELVHTYSLIHDDLPCMDDDDMRRGRPSAHKAFGEATALLAGDLLLTFSFQLLAESPGLSADQKIALVQTLSSSAGASGMIGGQELDLLYAEKTIDWEELKTVHARKTAALFSAAFEFGGIVGGAPDLALLREMGQIFGLAFQLKDDLDDSGQDAQKMNAVHLLGKEKVEQHIAALEDRFEDLLSRLPVRPALFPLTV